MRIGDLMQLSLREVKNLSQGLQDSYEFFSLHAQIPHRPGANTFTDLPLGEQKVFALCKEKLKGMFPGIEVWATGSRVHGRISHENVYTKSGLLIRKKSDYDLWLVPTPPRETRQKLKRTLSEITGENIDIMPIPPGHYFPVLI